MITKDSINKFISVNNPRAITQTGYWLDLEKTDKNHAHIIYTSRKNEINASVLLIKQHLPMGKNYLYAPYGPVINKNVTPDQLPKILEDLLLEIKKFIDLSNTIFIRFEPFYQDCHFIYCHLAKLGFKPTKGFTQPKDTLILNLMQSENEIFNHMKQKTRYNIRLADKKNIQIEKTNDPEQTKIFYELMLNTCDRDHFKPHPYEHYRNLISILGPQDIAYIYHAHFEKKIIASIIVSFYGKVATYLHGASSNTYRNLMPTYALQWQAIKDAIKKECHYYDFGGIAPENSPANHPWQGITRFKEGFGGINVSTIGHMEKTLHPFWHYAYKIGKMIQR